MNLRISGRVLTLAAMGVLVIWLCVWIGLLTDTDRQQRILWLALALAPLLIVGYHVWRNRKSGFAWCGFAALGYFAQGVTVVLTSKSDANYASVELFISLLMFTAASATLRAYRQISS